MFFQKNQKIILISIGLTVILILIIAGFFLLKKQEKKEIIKTGEKKQEFHFLSKEEKNQLKIGQNIEVEGKRVKNNLGDEVWIVKSFESSKWEDTDQDGISNEEEKKRGTDPLKKDSDNDGLDDFFEFKIGTNPLNPDTNGDGISDSMEVKKKMQSKQ